VPILADACERSRAVQKAMIVHVLASRATLSHYDCSRHRAKSTANQHKTRPTPERLGHSRSRAQKQRELTRSPAVVVVQTDGYAVAFRVAIASATSASQISTKIPVSGCFRVYVLPFNFTRNIYLSSSRLITLGFSYVFRLSNAAFLGVVLVAGTRREHATVE
jgi:hypothetical protein